MLLSWLLGVVCQLFVVWVGCFVCLLIDCLVLWCIWCLVGLVLCFIDVGYLLDVGLWCFDL